MTIRTGRPRVGEDATNINIGAAIRARRVQLGLSQVALSERVGVSFQQIAPGADNFRGFTCGLATTGTAWCWGANDLGQLGRGNRDIFLNPHPQPEPVSGTLIFSTLVAGLGDHVCGLTAAGAAYCWGSDESGALGDGGGNASLVPFAVPGEMAFEQLVTGGGYTCGLTSSSVAYCWGSNSSGQIGDGTLGGFPRRLVLVSGGHQFARLSAGYGHACGRTIGGIVYCWGSGRVGQLGIGYTTMSALPLKVSGQP